MIENLQEFAGSFPDWLQWLGVALVSAIPFVESYTGTLIGIAIGLHPAVAVSASIAGNAACVLAVVWVTARIRERVTSDDPPPPTKGRQRARRLFDRFGIPGVALIGHPTQISAAAMIGFGADRTKVVVWELVSIVVWGLFFAVVGGLGLQALHP